MPSENPVALSFLGIKRFNYWDYQFNPEIYHHHYLKKMFPKGIPPNLDISPEEELKQLENEAHQRLSQTYKKNYQKALKGMPVRLAGWKQAKKCTPLKIICDYFKADKLALRDEWVADILYEWAEEGKRKALHDCEVAFFDMRGRNRLEALVKLIKDDQDHFSRVLRRHFKGHSLVDAIADVARDTGTHFDTLKEVVRRYTRRIYSRAVRVKAREKSEVRPSSYAQAHELALRTLQLRPSTRLERRLNKEEWFNGLNWLRLCWENMRGFISRVDVLVAEAKFKFDGLKARCEAKFKGL